MNNAKYFIENLELQKHPEGGWFKEVYRSKEKISKQSLDDRFPDDRNISTSILFLLEKSEFSAFHRIKSDELWHFHSGDSLSLFSISPSGTMTISKLGLDISKKESPQIVIPQGHYFAARSNGDYTLVGCTVAPGFDFADFEMPEKEVLYNLFPAHKKLISEF